jgi:hypothetical protein
MKPIYSTGDKVYLTESDDFNDYEIVEITMADDSGIEGESDNFKYKIKPVKGEGVVLKSEAEIFPITA